jgi:hypothetical protein
MALGKTQCNPIRLHKYPTRGVEHTADFSGNHGVALQGGAKSGALYGDHAPRDRDLDRIIKAWPTLPEAVRRQVVGLVRAAVGA